MVKKGQLTLFIIIGIVIALSIIFFSFFGFKSQLNVSSDGAINNFIKDCLEDSALNGVKIISSNGGFFELPSGSLNSVPYYYDNVMKFPSQEDIENGLSLYVQNSMFFCIQNFNDYPNYNITAGKIDVISKILDDRVTFEVNYPVSAEIQGKKIYFDSFEYSVPVRLTKIHDLSKETIISYKENNALCINCIYDLSNEYDLDIQFFDFNDSYVFLIIDKHSIVLGEPIKFYFAIKK